MSILLLSEAALEDRSRVARGPRAPLAPLASSLADDLDALLARDLYFPRDKALLSRDGGRCAIDGAQLDFDPFSPHAHRCPRCGTVHHGELHDRFWIYWYQLWLAERAVHAAVLARVAGHERFASLAYGILDGYVDRYAAYPNDDNVLGPTRLFFSTYLESIWLLNICVATDLVAAREPALLARVLEAIVAPSRAIIAEYDEGASNRQVWNAAALLASALLLGDRAGAERAVSGPSGIVSHLAGGLLPDGTWFEGENYHLFAHRGLWYGVTMAERAGIALPPALVDRFQRGFATPFLTALPDFTFPSRRDSQYAVSLRQWRIAEHCELGFARAADPVLAGALDRMYEPEHERGDSGRSRSSADVERNAHASRLTRADLSWRALLFAVPIRPLPSATAISTSSLGSALLDAQGIAVFRRDAGRVYIALDYGHSGGGHGHPDRLNLLLADGDTRWLDDYGTGSYVERSLHWYRSTLAHNAPLVDGHSQQRVNGQLLAYDERESYGWIVAAAEIADGVRATRTLVVAEHYLIDELSWDANREVRVDLPIHTGLSFDAGVHSFHEAVLNGGSGMEDGFDFAFDASCQRADAHAVARGAAIAPTGNRLRVWTVGDQPVEWWRATAPGPPGSDPRIFRIARSTSARGRLRTLFAWGDAVRSVDFGEEVVVTLADGSVERHAGTAVGWRIRRSGAAVAQSIELGGARRTDTTPAPRAEMEERASIMLPRPGERTVIELGEPHYRRSERAWAAVGITARVTLSQSERGLRIVVDVPVSDLTFASADAVNPFDNEPADINGDGVQLYLLDARGLDAWMLVPERQSDAVRVRAIDEPLGARAIDASWRPRAAGYELTVDIPGPPPEALDLIVNETPRGRTRRRGQLVLSGARGEFVYLRGDRHDARRLLTLRPADG